MVAYKNANPTIRISAKESSDTRQHKARSSIYSYVSTQVSLYKYKCFDIYMSSCLDHLVTAADAAEYEIELGV